MRVILYKRVSSNEQFEHGVSLDAQEERLRKYSDGMGWVVVESLADEAVSASIDLSQRPRGQIAMKMLENDEADAIISIKLDRLFRSVSDALQSVDVLNKLGKHLVILDMGGGVLDTSTSHGRFLLTLMSALGELERGMTSERTRSAMQYKRQSKQVYCQNVYGWNRDGDSLVRNEEEQAVIKAMVQARERGHSFQAIADALKRSGILTKTGKAVWSRKVVSNIIANKDMHSYEDLQPVPLEFIMTKGGKEYVAV